MIIGLDVGGTHTDAVLIGTEGVIHSVKVATDPENLFDTLITALKQLTQDQDVDAIQRLVLSTTLATNMVVQQRLPDVGVLVSAGPGISPHSYAIGDNYHVIRGALDHSGRELAAIDTEQVRKAGEQLQSQGIRYAAVVSKFSVRNPAHEKRMAEVLAPYVDSVFMGHTISGSLSFPRRITTTYLNAAVSSVHDDFFKAVEQTLRAQGLEMPIRILKPDGGNLNLGSLHSFPAQTILSGPSASVMGALASAPSDRNCLILDIGGTTTDMAILLQGAPVIAPQGIEIGSYKTLIRALMSRSIGIGGDSVVRLVNGEITIGPDREGVAMAFGGETVTTTDAIAVIGDVEGADRNAARVGLASIADELNLGVEETAERIFDRACRDILAGAAELIEHINSRPVYTVHEMFEGMKIDPDCILVLGGPAEHFAKRLKTMFSGTVEAIPHWQVANAIGCALSRTTCEVTVYADTGRNILTTQGEELSQNIPRGSGLTEIRNIALDLVRKKAIQRGAISDYLELEVVEESQFNMIRGHHSAGKNIRVRAQVKPGLIVGYDPESGRLIRNDF